MCSASASSFTRRPSRRQPAGAAHRKITMRSSSAPARPRGRDLDIPGRREAAANIISASIGCRASRSAISTRSAGASSCSVAAIRRWIAARSSRRLGGEEVRSWLRSGFQEMKASAWEKEDAMHEGIPILNFMVPARVYPRRRASHRRAVRQCGPRSTPPAGAPLAATGEALACTLDDVLIAVGQENSFLGSSATLALRSTVRHAARRQDHLSVDPAERLLWRRRRLRAEEHHLGGGTWPRGRRLDRRLLSGQRRASPIAAADQFVSRRWASTNGPTTILISLDLSFKVPHKDNALAAA